MNALVTSAVLGTPLLLLAWAATRVLAERSARLRHRVLAMVAVALLASTAARAILPDAARFAVAAAASLMDEARMWAAFGYAALAYDKRGFG